LALSLQGTDIGHRLDRDPVDGRFVGKHRDLRLARLKRIKDRLDQLRLSYDATSPGDLCTLSLVATMYADAETARSRIGRVRSTNAALRLLKTLRRIEPPKPSIEEILGYDEPSNG
jgi:hypothetical protein